MKFDKVYVIGSGTICIKVINSLLKKKIRPVCLMYSVRPISLLPKTVKSKNIEHYLFHNKRALTEFLEHIENSALILSVDNLYLFPSTVVRKKNLKIVNFHNSYLPSHKGINAPMQGD